MSHTRTSLLAAALAGAALVPATAAAQGTPTTLSAEQSATRVAAFESTVMWSRLDPASGRYALLKSVGGGAPTAVAVAPRSGGPFDIDLGSNRAGRPFAVYTRDGDVYRLNVATGAETKLDKLSSPKLAERDPTIQRGEIAFIRRNGRFDELRIGNTTGASKGSRLLVRRASILHAELGIRHIAYVTSVQKGVGGEQQMHIRNISSGADKIVYRARSGGANFASITRASYVFAPAGFIWARTNIGSQTGNRIVRYTLGGSKLAYAQGSSRYISTAWANDELGVVTTSTLAGSETPDTCVDGGVSYCGVMLTGPLSFGLKP
jgi:hypothetical protein